jgi:hypothetical protein
VIVDVAGNSGGNDSGDWLTRLFTANDVHSARLFLTAHESADNYFNEQSDNLHEVAKKTPTKNVAAHNAINEAINAFGLRHDKISTGRCDLGWTWKEQRPWSPLGCNNLIDAGYASGQSDYLPPGSFGDQDVAAAIYWAANVDTYRGAWIGPVYVLVDNKTTSSAEMFAATMKDNGIAKIVGRQTGGAGCGFMGEVAPLVLPNSHLRFRVPNCVRLRKDDSDEVAGIAPDLKIVPRQGESGRDQAFRLIESVGADLK